MQISGGISTITDPSAFDVQQYFRDVRGGKNDAALHMGGKAETTVAAAPATIGAALSGAAGEASGAGPSPASLSGNLMARNFFDADARQSRYIEARETSFQVLHSIRNSQLAVLQAGTNAAEAAASLDPDRYDARILEGQKAARRMEDTKDTAVTEASGENLKDIREGIEETAEEAANSQHGDVSAAPEGHDEAEATPGTQDAAAQGATEDASPAGDAAKKVPAPEAMSVSPTGTTTERTSSPATTVARSGGTSSVDRFV